MFASIAIPSYLAATTLTASPLSLALPLLVVVVTLFIKLRKSKEKRNLLLLATVALLATHPIALLIVPVFILSLAFATIRRARDLTIQLEYAIFTTFLATWAYVLVFKDAIRDHGINALSGNLPAAIRATTYGMPDLLAFGIAVGVIPFGLAIYAAYKEGAAEHASIQTAIAFALAAVLATAARLVPTDTGVAVFALAGIALAGVGLDWLVGYLKTVRGTTIPAATFTVIAIAFVATSIVPTATSAITVAADTVPAGVVDAATWLHGNSLPTSVILTEPPWGAAIALIAKRPVLIHEDYGAYADSDGRHRLATTLLARAQGTGENGERYAEYIITDADLQGRCLNPVHGTRVRVWKVLC
jgi:hypothetical protein